MGFLTIEDRPVKRGAAQGEVGEGDAEEVATNHLPAPCKRLHFPLLDLSAAVECGGNNAAFDFRHGMLGSPGSQSGVALSLTAALQKPPRALGLSQQELAISEALP